MNLILIEPSEIGSAGDVRLSGSRAEHLMKVLRVAVGDRIRVGAVDGPRGSGAVQAVADGVVALRCTFDDTVPPPPRVDLLLALPRPKVMRRLWAQVAALGVGQIILTNAERVERNYFDTHLLDPAIFRPLLIEGLQQARDTRVPAVSVHKQLKVLIEDDLNRLFGAGIRIVADPAGTQPLSTVVRGRPGERVLVALGPEGGWNDYERRLLDAHGFRSASMGARTLRSDTACVALLALAHDAIASR